jgi:tol-pal system protein YbgF
MRQLARWLAVAAMLWACVLPAASNSVEMRLRALESRLPDADRLAALEKSLNNQNAAVLSGELEQLKAEVRSLRGQVEQLAHQIQKMQQGQGLLYEDLDKRLQKLEARAAGLPAIPPAATGATPDAAPAGQNATPHAAASSPADPDQEQADYLAAFELLQQGKTHEAVTAFQGFLERYPQGAYAANALYWLGEAHYVNKNYPLALAEFQRLTTKYPESQKLSGAMLKIGYIHYETRNFTEARTVLEQVKARYPDTHTGTLAAERLERMQKEGV